MAGGENTGPSSSHGFHGMLPAPDVGIRPTSDLERLRGEASPSRPSASQASLQSAETRFRSPRSQVTYSDRFIPSRAASSRLNFSVFDREQAASDAHKPPDKEEGNAVYHQLLRAELLGVPPTPASPEKPSSGSGDTRTGSPMTSPVKKMFRYKSGDRYSPLGGAPAESPYARSPVGFDATLMGAPSASPKRAPRKIPRSPFKVLDAPALQDDFYLNLVDWSSLNVLAVGLGSCVYLWSACTSKVTKLCDLASDTPADTISSVAWSLRGTYLAIGTNRGDTQLWDVVKAVRVRTLMGHRGRVSTMAWSSHLLSTGSRDRSILHRDVRAPEDFTAKLLAHRSEVCGLKWSPDDRELASGGNDNQLLVWNAHSPNPLIRFTEHEAAVKAIAWSPHQHGLLGSGGGTADRCIRFWNTATGAALSSLDTGSQVCNLSWSKNVNEIVSTHGYSQNQIIVWKQPSMTKLATLTGHTMRVLYLAVSPDGQTIVTGAGDETLRFWNVFPGAKSQEASVTDSTVGSMMRTQIR